MSAATAACPSWCTRHSTLGGESGSRAYPWHVSDPVTVDDIACTIEWVEGQDMLGSEDRPQIVMEPEYTWLHPAEARRYAAALAKAADLIEASV